MATIDLGKIKQVWRGTYASGTAYTPDDVVQYTDSGLVSSYICIANTTGNAPSSSGTAHASWNYLAKGGAAGADGTDVGATLANKEIAFKTNAGAVDGIPIGTAGQFLKVNSGATGYEYGAVSSDYVKLVSGTHSGTELNLDNIFTTSYPLYKVFMYDVITPNSWLGLRARIGGASGTTITASEYRYGSKMFFKPSGGYSDTSESGWGDTKFRIAWTNQSNSEKPQYFELTFPEPWSTATKFSYGMANTFINDTYVGHAIGAGQLDRTASEVYTGLNFYQDGGNSWTGKYAVYAIKI